MRNKSKFKRQRRKFLEKRFMFPIAPNKKLLLPPNKTVTHKFYRTNTDRVIYCYEIDGEKTIQKVVDVSYDVYVNNQWVTIVRYDSKHGFLHRHMRVSLENISDTPTTGGVIKRGKPQTWLTWARKDVSKNFLNYRVGFFKRSKIKDLY